MFVNSYFFGLHSQICGSGHFYSIGANNLFKDSHLPNTQFTTRSESKPDVFRHINWDNEFSTEFSVMQTQIYACESHPFDKPDDVNVTQNSPLTAEEVLYETLSSVQNEIQENFLNTENLIGKISEDQSDYYLEFINKNFINLN